MPWISSFSCFWPWIATIGRWLYRLRLPCCISAEIVHHAQPSDSHRSWYETRLGCSTLSDSKCCLHLDYWGARRPPDLDAFIGLAWESTCTCSLCLFRCGPRSTGASIGWIVGHTGNWNPCAARRVRLDLWFAVEYQAIAPSTFGVGMTSGKKPVAGRRRWYPNWRFLLHFVEQAVDSALPLDL